MSLRAIRRHHAARLKKSRAAYWGTKEGELSSKQLGILTTTPKPCGCWQCNKPRKVFGKPISQIRLEQALFYADE